MDDACPQKEHGYTPIANEIMDALISSDLKIPPESMKVLLLILRETYGFSRKVAKFKAGYIAMRTRLSRQNARRALNRLVEIGLVTVVKSDYGVVLSDYAIEITFQKNYKNWHKLKKKGIFRAYSNLTTPVVRSDYTSLKQPLKQPKDILSAAADSPPPAAEGSAGKVNVNKNGLPYAEVVAYLNEKSHKQFKPNSKKTRALIKARFDEGFTFEDFKTVIDNKARGWLNDPEMNPYLRPETLFGTKFEGYLNEKKETRRPTYDDERKFLP